MTDWIPCSERLPEPYVEVFVTIKGSDLIIPQECETLEEACERASNMRWVTRAYWSEEENGWNDPGFGGPLIARPIAWMPMPCPKPWEGDCDET